MERIDRKYAIIYVDWDGETLQTVDGKVQLSEYDIANIYYNTEGFLQWNIYLMIPEDLVNTGEEINSIESSTTYARKYVTPREDINTTIELMFPIMTENHGSIKIIEGVSWDNVSMKAANEVSVNGGHLQGSFYRNLGLLETLRQMDLLRANMVRNPKYKGVFYSHIENEISIAKHKFKLFIK